MSAPLGPKFDQVMKSPAVQELLKQRPDVPSEKPEVQKTVEELEEERRALEVACKTFAGADGKGGTIAELTDIVQAEEQEEAELIELLGANADLEAELAPAREARAEDRKQIESLKRAYDTLLEEIAALNKQIREARDAQVKEGKEEVEKEGEKIEDLTEHAVMEPPPVPFKAREASMRVEERRQAALAEAPDLTEHAVLQPPSIPEAVREASMKRYAERQAAQASPGVNASNETSFATAEATTTPIKETPPVDAPKTTPEKPEPAAKNEKGPENIAQAQALIAEQQREQMEVRQRLLALYKTYKEELLPQTQGVYEVAQALGGLGAVTTPGAEKAGPFASLQLGAKMQLDDARSLQGLFTGLQAEAMKNTPKDIEAATRDVQLVTARLQMRMQGLQGYRNTILGLRTALPRGSAREQALLALDAAAGKAWKAAGKMQAEWQPIGSKIQARNGREHHKLYEQAYNVITDARAKGEDVAIEIPEDVIKNMPTETVPAGENLSSLQAQVVSLDLAAITKEITESPVVPKEIKKQEVRKDRWVDDEEEASPVSEAEYRHAHELREKMEKAESIRAEVAEDIVRRARRLSADLDGVKTKQGQELQKALKEVLLEGDTVVYAAKQSDRLDRGQGTIWVYNQRLLTALKQAEDAVHSAGPDLSDDVRTAVRRLASFGQDLPAFVELDDAEAAKKTVDRYTSQQKRAQDIPRIGI
jgi:hypothetical protein